MDSIEEHFLDVCSRFHRMSCIHCLDKWMLFLLAFSSISFHLSLSLSLVSTSLVCDCVFAVYSEKVESPVQNQWWILFIPGEVLSYLLPCCHFQSWFLWLTKGWGEVKQACSDFCKGFKPSRTLGQFEALKKAWMVCKFFVLVSSSLRSSFLMVFECFPFLVSSNDEEKSLQPQ